MPRYNVIEGYKVVARYRGGTAKRPYRGTWRTKDGRFTVKYLNAHPGVWTKGQRQGGVEITDHSRTPERRYRAWTLAEARQLMGRLYDAAGVTRDSVRAKNSEGNRGGGRKPGPRAHCPRCGPDKAEQVSHQQGGWGHQCRVCRRRWTVEPGQCGRWRHGIKAKDEAKAKGGR